MNTDIRILQLSDSHLFKNKQPLLFGTNTFDAFQLVIQKIKEDTQKNKPRLILFTGDLSHDDSIESYQTIFEHMKNIPVTIAWLPGNHENIPVAQKILSHPPFTNDKYFDCQTWQVILLNSHWPGHIAGKLDQKELTFLETKLKENPQKFSLICLHHHPISSHSLWLDTINLKNANDFLAMIKKYKNIKCVAFSHIHQVLSETHDNILFTSTPSACVQFATKTITLKVSTEKPGYRRFNLLSDGQIETDIIRTP